MNQHIYGPNSTWPAPMGRRFLYPGVEEDIYGGDWEATVGLLEDVHR